MKTKKDLLEYLGRYECTDKKSNKFWELKEDKDGDIVVTSGKIGTTGTSCPWDGSSEITYSELISKAKNKLKKGYLKIS
jgi:predicted DNA-binding WGR domain protein